MAIDLSFRPFGLLRNDLDIDFDQPSRPHLVTQILLACATSASSGKVEPAFFWQMTVGKRIECLVRIDALVNHSALPVLLRCLNQACAQQIELTFSLEELTSLQRKSDEKAQCSVHIGEEEILLRKPTGQDQLKWQQGSFRDQAAATRAMIQTLLIEPTSLQQRVKISDEEHALINEAMQAFDPLVNLVVVVACPYCSQQRPYEIEIQEIVLKRLRKVQMRLIEEVHRLAFSYHWNEEQIMSLPAWRRARYLTLLEREENRGK